MKNFLCSISRCTYLLFTVMFCFSATSFATIYYIDPSGNDVSGNGSKTNPWKTLFKATQTVINSGDIIHVNAGTYTETQQSNLRVGVSVEGERNTVSIIKSGVTGQFSVLLSLNSPQDTNGNQSISYLTLDGNYVSETNFKTWIAIWVTGRSNVIIHDCKIQNFRDRGVIYDGNDAQDPHSDPGHYATGNKFYSNTVTNSAGQNASYGSGLLNIGGQQGMEIYGNTMIQDQRGAFLNGWPLKYWDEGWLRGVKIYNNTLTKNPYNGSFPGENGGWDFAIEFFNIQGLEIYNNFIKGSIDLNYNYKGSYDHCAWIHHNTLDRTPINNNFESGIILEFRTESILIEYNTFNNLSSGVQFNTRGVDNPGGNNPTNPAPVGGYSYLLNNVIQKNLFSNVYQGNGVGTGAGITVISEGTNDPQILNMDIYNNTIVAKSGDAPYAGIDFSSMTASTASGRNINIRNNIVMNFNGPWLVGASGNSHLNTVVVTHNDAYQNGNNTPSWPGGNPTNYTYNNNLSVNPLFKSSTDYHLQPTSPLIDRGVYVGLPYSGNAPDIGYDEVGLGGPLPITLVDFNVKENNGTNLLQWTTATESNSDYFDIERSNDGRSFQSIGRVNASGFSTIEIKYYFTDVAPMKGINYYRLAMMDKGGKSEYSKIVSINSKERENIAITYVDLSSGSKTASIKIYSPQSQPATIAVIDMGGRTVLNINTSLQKGINTVTQSIPALLNGIYYIKVYTNTETAVKNTVSRN